MVGGKVKDIHMDEKVTIEELDLMHFQKTGRLIQTSLEIVGHLSQLEEETIELLVNYGEKIGLAFQIQDDIIDIESPALVSGKSPVTTDSRRFERVGLMNTTIINILCVVGYHLNVDAETLAKFYRNADKKDDR